MQLAQRSPSVRLADDKLPLRCASKPTARPDLEPAPLGTVSAAATLGPRRGRQSWRRAAGPALGHRCHRRPPCGFAAAGNAATAATFGAAYPNIRPASCRRRGSRRRRRRAAS